MPLAGRQFDSTGVPAHMAQAFQHTYAGAWCLDQGDSAGAESNWRKAVEVYPECVLAWSRLTDLLVWEKRLPEAVDCLNRTIAAVPNPSDELRLSWQLAFANINFLQNDWDAALEHTDQILLQDPANFEALAIRQKCFDFLHRASEEVATLRSMLALKPDGATHGLLLFKMNLLAGTTPEMIYEEGKRWNDLYAAPLKAQIPRHANTRDPDRRLKIAYVSPDFKHHAIMKLLPAVIEGHDQQRFEVFAYSVDTREDYVTRYVRDRLAEHFVELPASGDAIAQRAQAQGIDILIDVAGHTMNFNAYQAFAMKPAPVQVTWMGVLATTGLSTMDYFLGDALMPCPGTDHLFSEKVYRLGRTHCCYRPSFDVPVAASPCLTNGFVTFGCFNGSYKVTRDMVKIWSVILHLHTGSKLILKYRRQQYEAVQRLLRNWFAEDGIAASRLQFEGSSGAAEYLASWNKVDIALDPYPYNGGTTTMDALWMGVPVVSLSGRLAVSSCGATLLSAVGLPVAQTPEQYVSLAAQFAKAIPETPDIRHRIRDAIYKSPLMDQPGMIQALENAYRDMWRTWCMKQNASA